MKCSDKEIGKRIAGLRKKYKKEDGKKLTQDELAKAVGLSRTIIAKIESGVQPLIPVQLYDLSKFFGVTTDYIVSGISAENVTVSSDLGLHEVTINALREWKVANDKECSIDKKEDNILNDAEVDMVEMLINDNDGRLLLDYLDMFIWTDFKDIYSSNPNISGAEPIRQIWFRGLGENEVNSTPSEFFYYVVLRSIDSIIERIRRKNTCEEPPVL